MILSVAMGVSAFSLLLAIYAALSTAMLNDQFIEHMRNCHPRDPVDVHMTAPPD